MCKFRWWVYSIRNDFIVKKERNRLAISDANPEVICEISIHTRDVNLQCSFWPMSESDR